MNDFVKSPGPAPPVSGNEVIPLGTLSLSELVARVNDEHRQLKECVIKGAQHAVKAGELLWEAKRKAGHGRWLEWISENCEFSERTAQLYMNLATALPQVANPQRIADLSLTGAIKMIEDLKAPEENPIPKARSSKKTDKLAEAIKNSPLAILERAWEQAEQNERNIFLKKIRA
jgi:mannose/cellobiose epimerase-like protein (N-acyl-D-glucosamine 2-epimerase family)